VEHLTVDLRLSPVFISVIGCIYCVQNHGNLVKHIADSSARVTAAVVIRHISLVFLVDCVTRCPRITEAHSQVVKGIKAQDSMPFDNHRAQGIGILCKFPIVSIYLVKTKVHTDLVDNTTCLLTSMSTDIRHDPVDMFCCFLRNSSCCIVGKVVEEVVETPAVDTLVVTPAVPETPAE
jgi:hypothetical protein